MSAKEELVELILGSSISLLRILNFIQPRIIEINEDRTIDITNESGLVFLLQSRKTSVLLRSLQ